MFVCSCSWIKGVDTREEKAIRQTLPWFPYVHCTKLNSSSNWLALNGKKSSPPLSSVDPFAGTASLFSSIENVCGCRMQDCIAAFANKMGHEEEGNGLVFRFGLGIRVSPCFLEKKMKWRPKRYSLRALGHFDGWQSLYQTADKAVVSVASGNVYTHHQHIKILPESLLRAIR